MNRTVKIFLMFLVVVGLSSCDLLENQEPQQSLPAEGGLESIADFESALTGAYNSIQEISGDNAAQVLFANDIIADNTVWTGSFPTYVQIASQQMAPNNGSIESQWDGAYEAINASNVIIQGLEELDANQAAKDNIAGQAYFIRALEHYYLVQYFAKPWGATSDNSHPGVPIQLKGVTSQDDFENPSRSSVAAVYEQIITDLKQAQQMISQTAYNKATSDAATALLARIALIQGRYGDAADLAGQVIPNYTLSESVTEYFRNEGSDESIFEIQNTTQDVPDAANTSITAVYNEGTRDDIQISQAYVDALDKIVSGAQETALNAANQKAIDTRVSMLLTSNDDGEIVVGTSNTDKYEDVQSSADNLPVLRLSEMILTRAEGLAEEQGVNQESIDLLNSIRTRAITVETDGGGAGNQELIEYTLADFQSKQELIDAILLERRVELSFEGHRKTDLQRREMDVAGTAWDADQLVFPIPTSQIDANKNICQNAGYGNGDNVCN